MDTFLIVQRGEDIGRRFDLDTVQLTVGRGADNDLVLNDPMVSRYHAVVKRQGNGYSVIDLGSSNPVVVNDQVLEAGISHQLAHRDVIFIGKTVFSFQLRPSDARGQGGGRAAPQQAAQRDEPVMETRLDLNHPAARGSHTEAMPRSQAPEPVQATPPPPPAARPPAPPLPPAAPQPAEDNDRTIIGAVRLGDPAESPSPAPRFSASDAPARPPADSPEPRPNSGNLPPLPSLGGAPAGGPATPPPPPFNLPRPSGPSSPSADRPAGPPADDEGDSPTVFIQRDRH